MRKDAVGFFWDDTPPPPPPKKEVEKRTPPKPTWLAPDYLPGLEEALRFPVHVMTDAELVAAQRAGEILANDDEVFPNYFLSMFVSRTTGWVTFVEMHEGQPLDIPKFRWILENFETTGFNSLNFDMTINAMALAGFDCAQLKQCSDKLIIEELRPSDVLKAGGVKKLEVNHVDIIELAPLSASLKTYGGRLHVRKLQDLPFHPSTVLNSNQQAIVRWYCYNDCTTTIAVADHVQEHLELRKEFGKQYGVDLRSRADAQMAEEVIRQEIKKVNGKFPPKPKYGEAVGTEFFYKAPSYVKFNTYDLQLALYEMQTSKMVVGPTGHVECPPIIRERVVTIGGKEYKVGMGGLHSKEKTQAIVATNHKRIFDRDVTGYYPNLILRNGFAPPRLGHVFLRAFGGMVARRTRAKTLAGEMKEAGDTKSHQYIVVQTEADGLKVVNNGTFGKLSDPFSTLYDVPNMVQVTLTGQLSLLMAIEMATERGFEVVSANTDGIVITCESDRYSEFNAMFKEWESLTGLETEETEYLGLYSRDVNNYIALKMDRKTKTKGVYCERGSTHNSVLSKNPEVLICSDAAQAWIAKGTPVEETIRQSRDFRRFVSLRTVTGGGVKVWDDDHTEYLGKTVRWYYAKDVPGEIVYAKTGNRVPKSEGAKPCMELPQEWPEDVDYDWYVNYAYRILREIGALAPEEEVS